MNDREDPAGPRFDGPERNRATLLSLLSPLAAAVLTYAVFVLDAGAGRPMAPFAGVTLVIILNSVLAFVGSAAGGLIRHEPLTTRIVLAVGFGTAGLVAYFALIGCCGAAMAGLWW